MNTKAFQTTKESGGLVMKSPLKHKRYRWIDINLPAEVSPGNSPAG